MAYAGSVKYYQYCIWEVMMKYVVCVSTNYILQLNNKAVEWSRIWSSRWYKIIYSL